jgi:hypothetical protein
MALIKYTGWRKNKTMSFPVGGIAKGDFETEIMFTSGEVTEVPDQYVDKLLEMCSHMFERVAQAPARDEKKSEKPAPTVSSGKEK